MSISILGDGLAGLMLADRLTDQGHDVLVFGDGASQTPPVGLVHLFAGRTFRRSALEQAVFATAMEHWRASPRAREFKVHRQTPAGDRLERSLLHLDLPSPLTPRPLKPGWMEYGPGFAVEAQRLEGDLRTRLGAKIRTGRFTTDDLPGPTRVLAVGCNAPDYLPEVRWDLSGGRVVRAAVATPSRTIVIGSGLHSVPAADDRTVVLGGRHSAVSGEMYGDELELAGGLTGQEHHEVDEWRGQRCSPMLDHRPVVGWLEGETLAFFGFGSRALFWLPYCVERAVEALTGATGSLPPEFSPTRFRS